MMWFIIRIKKLNVKGRKTSSRHKTSCQHHHRTKKDEAHIKLNYYCEREYYENLLRNDNDDERSGRPTQKQTQINTHDGSNRGWSIFIRVTQGIY